MFILCSLILSKFFIHQQCTDDCLKNYIKSYIKIAPTCFGAAKTSSGAHYPCLLKLKC